MDPKASHAQFFLALTLLEQNHWAQSDESMCAFRALSEMIPKIISPISISARANQIEGLRPSNQHLRSTYNPSEIPEIWLYFRPNHSTTELSRSQDQSAKAVELIGPDEARNNFQIRKAYIALWAHGVHCRKQREGGRIRNTRQRSPKEGARQQR
jgi:hypothetical protein